MGEIRDALGQVGNALARRAAQSVVAVERRDPRAATRRTNWAARDLPQVQDWDADQAFRLGYLANVIAYRCVQLRANACSSVPLLAGVNGKHNPASPLAALFSPPNLGGRGAAPKLSTRRLMRWTYAQEIVTGRRAWEIDTGDASASDEDAPPVAFWPMASGSLREVPTEGGVEWFKLFEYGPQAKPTRLQPHQVFYGWDPSGLDFRKAESAFQVARFDLSLVTLCDRYGLSFLQNNAVPAAIITTTQFPNDTERQRFRRNWQNEYGGVDNAGRVGFHEVSDDPHADGPVGDSIHVEKLGLSAKDAMLVETRKEAVREVAIALGVPWSKLDASGRTYDNAEAEDKTYWEETNLPDMLDLLDDLNTQIAPRLGNDRLWFDFSVVPALRRRVMPVTQSVGAPALLMARIMMINEARADYGLEPIEGGDRFLTDDELALLKGADGEEAQRSILALIGMRTPEQPPVIEATVVEPPALPPASEPVVEDRAADPEAVEARRALVWRSTDAQVSTIEQRWMRAFRRLFKRQADATVARLTGKRGRQMLEQRDGETDPIDAAGIFDIAFWTAATVELAEDLYEQAMVAGVERVALTFATSFDLSAPWVAETIASRANQLAGQVTQTTYDAILAELVAGVADGESIDDIATRIRTVFAQADTVRSVTIARTEVISAYNGAAVAVVERDMPRDVVAAAEWIATRDSRTRDSHASADGQLALIGTPFTVSGYSAAYPGDPALPAKETVRCRCTVAFLTPEDYAEATERSPQRIEARTARALLDLVPFGDDFDELRFRRVLQEVAA